jgi:N6-L-threonylcarbamoyladenine synthase
MTEKHVFPYRIRLIEIFIFIFCYRLQALAASYGLPLICPPPKLCTDNGVMIAWAGIERYQAGLIDNYEMTTIPKWPIEQLKYVSSN